MDVRRWVDAAGATVLLILSAPFGLVAAAAIKLDSPGPVFFRQVRIGRNREQFVVLKLRTMTANSPEEPHRAYVTKMLTEGVDSSGGVFKLVDDPRVTKVGAFLRRMSFDEVPQLVNVIRGEMAIVGPRPMLRYEADLLPAWGESRFAVRPGITGLWQVSARNSIDLLGAVRLDVDYVQNRSVALDLRILAATAKVLLGRSVAA